MSTRTKFEMISRLRDLGFTFEESMKLRRIQMTLNRWAEYECGTGNDRVTLSIERDEETQKPFMRRQYQSPHGWIDEKHPTRDLELGALKRLKAIMASHPELVSYHQGDCRGCSLYILRKADVNAHEIDQVYTRGVAVCD